MIEINEEKEVEYFYQLSNNYMENTKRYFISSLVTFLTGVCLVLINDIDSITIASFKDGTVAGLIFVAVRGGIKALIEAFLASKIRG